MSGICMENVNVVSETELMVWSGWSSDSNLLKSGTGIFLSCRSFSTTYYGINYIFTINFII